METTKNFTSCSFLLSFPGGARLFDLPSGNFSEDFSSDNASFGYKSHSFLTPIYFLVILALLNNFRGKSNGSRLNSAKVKGAQRKLPLVSHFSVKVPNLVTGLYTLRQFKKAGLKFLVDVHLKYGDIYEIPVGNEMVTVISEPSAVQKVLLSSHPGHLNKPKAFYALVDGFKDGLLCSEYDVWSSHRKFLSRCFTLKSLRSYVPCMNEHSRSLVNHLKSLCSADLENSVRGKQVYSAIISEALSTIIHTIIGRDESHDEGHMKMQHALKRQYEIVEYRLSYPALLIPIIWRLHPMKVEHDKLVVIINSMAQKQIEKYKANCSNEEGKKVEIKGSKSGSEKENDAMGIRAPRTMLEELVSSGLTDREMLDEVATFISVGHESTSTIINLLLFHLACNQECQHLCWEEIDHLHNSKGESEKENGWTLDDLDDMKYLERCILEGLRLTPVLPFFLRQLSAPIELAEDLTLEEGTTVLLSPWTMHRDPKNFTSPLKFDPDRFLPENKEKLRSYQPFSAGKRNCIGYKYALMEMKIVLAYLLHDFKIFTKDRPEDINYLLKVTIHPEKEIDITLRRRKAIS